MDFENFIYNAMRFYHNSMKEYYSYNLITPKEYGQVLLSKGRRKKKKRK